MRRWGINDSDTGHLVELKSPNWNVQMCATVVQYNRLQLHPSQLRSHTFRQITRKSQKQPEQKNIFQDLQVYICIQSRHLTQRILQPPHPVIETEVGLCLFQEIFLSVPKLISISNHLQGSFCVRGQMRRWRGRINLGEKLQPVPVYLTVSSFRLLPRRDHDPRDPLHHQASTFQSHSLHFSSWSEAALLFVCKLEFSFTHLHLFSAQKGYNCSETEFTDT